MWAFINSLNSREQAIATWLLLFIVWILLREDTRTSVYGVLKAFFNNKIISVVVAMLTYTAIVVFLFARIGLWHQSLIKETVFWIVGTAFVLLMNSNKATQNISFFKETATNSLKLIVILEFIVNFYTFNYWFELILVPVLLIIGGMNALAEIRPEYKQARKWINSLMTSVGLLLITYALGRVLSNFQNFASVQNFRTFTLAPLLTLSYIPFLYVFGLVMAYEMLFVRLGIFIKDENVLTFTKWKIFLLCNFNLGQLNVFAQNTGGEIIKLRSKHDVLSVIKNFKETKKVISGK